MKNLAKPHNANPRKQRGGILLGLFLGLVVGMLIAFALVWYLNKSPLPFLDKFSRQDKPAAEEQQQSLPLPGRPGEKVSDKPRFEFYQILPGCQEATPTAPAASTPTQQQSAQPQAAPQPQAASQPPGAAQPLPPQGVAQPPAAGETYYLQAGAFQKAADADNLKAKLAMMGLETSLQEISVPDKGVMNRVRVGPFATAEEMNRARNQLAQNGVQATVVKIRNGSDAAH